MKADAIATRNFSPLALLANKRRWPALSRGGHVIQLGGSNGDEAPVVRPVGECSEASTIISEHEGKDWPVSIRVEAGANPLIWRNLRDQLVEAYIDPA